MSKETGSLASVTGGVFTNRHCRRYTHPVEAMMTSTLAKNLEKLRTASEKASLDRPEMRAARKKVDAGLKKLEEVAAGRR